MTLLRSHRCLGKELGSKFQSVGTFDGDTRYPTLCFVSGPSCDLQPPSSSSAWRRAPSYSTMTSSSPRPRLALQNPGTQNTAATAAVASVSPGRDSISASRFLQNTQLLLGPALVTKRSQEPTLQPTTALLKGRRVRCPSPGSAPVGLRETRHLSGMNLSENGSSD